MLVLASDGQNYLADVDTSDRAVRLSPCTTHPGLESISTSARQHLVDADDVERMHADPEVEGILSGRLGDVLVGAYTGSLESLAR